MSHDNGRNSVGAAGARIILPAGVAGSAGDGWTREAGMPAGDVFRHRGRMLAAIRSRDMGRWHLSVSHRDRIPTWGELGFARDCLLPVDAWMMVAHPPRKYWLNYDSRVLHLWEFRDPELIEQFIFEGEHAQQHGYGTADDGEAPIRNVSVPIGGSAGPR